MARPAILALQDGSWYEGESFGAEADSYGEVVFNTSMTGYQEILTDPSYAGQIVMPTYPIMGNYGVNGEHMESRQIRVAGFAVRDHCLDPSHNLSTMTLHEYLASQGIAGISGIDTRAVTRKLRFAGVMMGMIAVGTSPEEALERLREAPRYDEVDFVAGVSAERPYGWDGGEGEQAGPLVLVSDYGLKYNILRILRSRGCRVMAIPVQVEGGGHSGLKPGRHRAVAWPRRPGAAGLRGGDGHGSHWTGAHAGDMPGTSGHCPGPGREHLQAEVRTQGWKPPCS